MKRYLSAKEAADALNISLTTLYAYVSRGLIRSEQTNEGKRERRYYAEDVEKLQARKEGRRNPEKLAQDALHWGAPVMDSAITLIDKGKVYYRAWDVERLAQDYQVEDVAALIWTGKMEEASVLFSQVVTARKYELLLMDVELHGVDLSPIQELQTFLPAASADDMSAYDLRPAVVALTGARILRLMVSVIAGDVPEDIPMAAMLQRGLCPDDERSQVIFNAALIATADHELNASSFAARVAASAGGTAYSAVLGGLSALQGVKHGGYTERVEAFFKEIGSPERIRETMVARLRRGETIPGFGHNLYPDGDPRAKILLKLLNDTYPDSPEMQFANTAIQAAQELIGEYPSVDTALVILASVLGLPEGSPLALFALGRTIGWIGHAIEQYERDKLIRPRARYTGDYPKP